MTRIGRPPLPKDEERYQTILDALSYQPSEALNSVEISLKIGEMIGRKIRRAHYTIHQIYDHLIILRKLGYVERISFENKRSKYYKLQNIYDESEYLSITRSEDVLSLIDVGA